MKPPTPLTPEFAKTILEAAELPTHDFAVSLFVQSVFIEQQKRWREVHPDDPNGQ